MKPRIPGLYRVIGYGDKHSKNGSLVGDYKTSDEASKAATAWLENRFATYEDENFVTEELNP